MNKKTTKFCEKCNKSVSKSNWSKHIKTKKHLKEICETIYKCKLCDFTSKYRQSIYNHNKIVHLGIKHAKKFKCLICDLLIENKLKCTRHVISNKHISNVEHYRNKWNENKYIHKSTNKIIKSKMYDMLINIKTNKPMNISYKQHKINRNNYDKSLSKLRNKKFDNPINKENQKKDKESIETLFEITKILLLKLKNMKEDKTKNFEYIGACINKFKEFNNERKKIINEYRKNENEYKNKEEDDDYKNNYWDVIASFNILKKDMQNFINEAHKLNVEDEEEDKEEEDFESLKEKIYVNLSNDELIKILEKNGQKEEIAEKFNEANNENSFDLMNDLFNSLKLNYGDYIEI